ncbi:LD-carboxypeptidase [Rickettsiella endosymbiont of Miltochrista miniata]|uniref:LD-carboxypeptidase n=1 Tax=Rickettsiella endosymbiont of Miltochrista miniata TaxID=3066239 RepID=UPI00313D3E03
MDSFKPWQTLKKNFVIDIIAPASGVTDTAILEKLKSLLKSWQLTPRISSELFGPDLLCANSDEKRFQQLKEALINTDSQAIWCLRGGYGCTRLIPHLLKLSPPEQCKLFIGFSDITALHLFLQQKWRWQTLHGPTLNQVVHHLIEEENINELKKVIFGQLPELIYLLTPYHKPINTFDSTQAPLTGGSLSLVQTSLGTDWQIETKDKILFLEDVNEVAYRIDRMLQHLQQSGILTHVKAILFGDFTFPTKLEEKKKIQAVLERFAKQQNFPVLRCPDIGHGKKNRCLPFGTPAYLDLNKNQLTIKITG